MIDAVHGRIEGTARRNFAANRDRLIEGEDFHLMNPLFVGKDVCEALGYVRPSDAM